MPWLGVPASIAAAYIAAKYEGTSLWTGFSVALWTIISCVILGAFALLLALPIAVVKVLLMP